MRNITFAADDQLLARAQGVAQLSGTTLNEEFHRWLAS
jgi:hypothetical protein